ncbi:MAG TPA: carboxylating nicotinate-nucleotide diphosphorylase [Candidatus Kapabacteria bacterium]|jgi:nicotinate-nucleotide pyrophosphorylase (carboxylating)
MALSDIERQRIRIALVEDEGREDITTLATIDEDVEGVGTFLAKQDGVLAGLDIASHVFSIYETLHGVHSNALEFHSLVSEGSRIHAGETLGTLRARARTLLAAERVALNLLQRISGIATMTRAFADAVEGTQAVILDTRKTAPLLRPFDRYAVRAGGGTNHRYSLADMVLVKDNHLAANGGSIEKVITRLQAYFLEHERVPVEIEVDSLDQFDDLLGVGKGFVDRVLFDNFPLDRLREAVQKNAGAFQTEASGGVDLKTVRSIAETGVNFISVGSLTHSVRALDISFEIQSL